MGTLTVTDIFYCIEKKYGSYDLLLRSINFVNRGLKWSERPGASVGWKVVTFNNGFKYNRSIAFVT
jgi:hypothetical protein